MTFQTWPPDHYLHTWEERFAFKSQARDGYNLVRRVEDKLEAWGDFKTRKTVTTAVVKAYDLLCEAINITEEAHG